MFRRAHSPEGAKGAGLHRVALLSSRPRSNREKWGLWGGGENIVL